MSPSGQSRRFDHVRDESDLPQIPDILRHRNKLALVDGTILKIFPRN